MTFLCIIALSEITVTHTFLPSFENANGSFCQQRLLRSHRPFRRGTVLVSCDRSVTAYEKDKRRLRKSQQVPMGVNM